MIQQTVRVDSNEEIGANVYLMKFDSRGIAANARPGQFLNVRAAEYWGPMILRRPFSISRIVGSSVELLYAVVGSGTKALAGLRPGNILDVLGPLGNSFRYDLEFDTAVIVAGGLGIAPFPFLTDFLEQRPGKNILTFVGSRSAMDVDRLHLRNVVVATDDGSKGYKGTVVESLEDYLKTHVLKSPRLFGCGPTRMLGALSAFAQSKGLTCELSLEGDMACGIGICQGCPVQNNKGTKKYALVCKEGPTFDCRDIVFPAS